MALRSELTTWRRGGSRVQGVAVLLLPSFPECLQGPAKKAGDCAGVVFCVVAITGM